MPDAELVIIAGPRLLALIRRHLSPVAQRRLLATLGKDLFCADREALESVVTGLLAGARPRLRPSRPVGSTSMQIRRR
jgi:hypothetical protein